MVSSHHSKNHHRSVDKIGMNGSQRFATNECVRQKSKFEEDLAMKESPRAVKPRRFESPRSHADLQAEEYDLTVLKSSQRFDQDIVHQTQQRSTQEAILRSSASSTEPVTGPRCRPQSVQTTTRRSLTDDTLRDKSSRRHAKIKALLEKLNRSTDSELLVTKDDSQFAGRRTVDSSSNRLGSRRRIRRAQSESETLSRGNSQADVGLLLRQTRKSRKRIPIRAFRMQQKAAITIQTICRQFLARLKHRRILLQQEFIQYIEGRGATRPEVQELDYSARVKNLEQQTQNEIEAMRASMELEKEKLESTFRILLAAQQASELDKESHQPGDSCPQTDQDVTLLQNEQKMLLTEITLLDGITTDLEQENEQMVDANQQIMTMFLALNDYAKSSVAQKKSLEEEAMTYNKLEVNKLRQQIRMCSSATMVETSAKNMYRGCIYQHTYTKVRSFNNSDIFEDVMNTIRECEIYLGNQVLCPNDAKALLEVVSDEDSESEDEI